MQWLTLLTKNRARRIVLSLCLLPGLYYLCFALQTIDKVRVPVSTQAECEYLDLPATEGKCVFEGTAYGTVFGSWDLVRKYPGGTQFVTYRGDQLEFEWADWHVERPFEAAVVVLLYLIAALSPILWPILMSRKPKSSC